MSNSKKRLPEYRNSHLAGQRERERAREVYEQTKQRQEEEKKMAQQTTPPSNVVTMVQQPLKSGRSGRALPFRERDTILAAIDREGFQHVTDDIVACCVSKNNASARTMLRKLERDPSHRYWSGDIQVLTELARRYRNELPFPRPAPHQVVSTTALAVQQPPSPPLTVESMTTALVPALVAALQAVGFGPRQPAQAKATAPQMAMMSDGTIREMLNSHHTALAREFELQGIKGAYNAAWRRSYRAFQEKTGVDIITMARDEGNATGKRVQAIDVIHRLGEMRRFWEIVRELDK